MSLFGPAQEAGVPGADYLIVYAEEELVAVGAGAIPDALDDLPALSHFVERSEAGVVERVVPQPEHSVDDDLADGRVDKGAQMTSQAHRIGGQLHIELPTDLFGQAGAKPSRIAAEAAGQSQQGPDRSGA